MTTSKSDYLAICDPVCVQEFGHNLAAIKRYASYLENKASKIDLFIGASLKECGLNPGDFRGELKFHFTHYYSRLIAIHSSKLDSTGRNLLALSSQEAHEAAKEAAIKELRKILDEASNHVKAIIFFPSIDYYSLWAIKSLKNEIHTTSTRILMRFIGVMEGQCYCQQPGEDLDSILSELALAAQASLKSPYRFSAESPVIAKSLEQNHGIKAVITPTLVDEERLPEPNTKPFTICFPGSARIDKGFGQVLNILTELDENYPFLEYQVILQSLPNSELIHHYNKQRELFKHPRVRAYPAKVSQEQLTEYIRLSHLMVMPYCKKTYFERSSAMMAEAACYGRQVVTSDECGFSEHVEELGIGITCRNEAEMAKAIVNYCLLDPALLSSMATNARRKYTETTLTSYQEFFA